eukprot:CAMPEP_0116881884 /NCGR_PEP_ID=MMETSP0463-20121206/13955_1 /TAXON_ID=181622 /ORGANISM="Strombidinopsis sp, Strain SopsisLIS2011" /LENGTH=136 /DNA_ID=CAMNT_0004534193 /DNA_START=267 /DNA_END=677 /DNA_ORIENTATION=+
MKIEPQCIDLPSNHFSKDIRKLSAFHDWLKLTPYLDRETLIKWYNEYSNNNHQNRFVSLDSHKTNHSKRSKVYGSGGRGNAYTDDKRMNTAHTHESGRTRASMDAQQLVDLKMNASEIERFEEKKRAELPFLSDVP